MLIRFALLALLVQVSLALPTDEAPAAASPASPELEKKYTQANQTASNATVTNPDANQGNSTDSEKFGGGGAVGKPGSVVPDTKKVRAGADMLRHFLGPMMGGKHDSTVKTILTPELSCLLPCTKKASLNCEVQKGKSSYNFEAHICKDCIGSH